MKSIPDIIAPIHPSRARLFAHAEAMAAGIVSVSDDVTLHVAECERCRTEVNTIHDSLGTLEGVTELEPSRRATAGILLSARNERRVARLRSIRMRRVVRVSQGMSVAAAAVFVVHLALDTKPIKPPVNLDAAVSLPHLPALDTATPAVEEQTRIPEIAPAIDDSAETLLRSAVVSTPRTLRSPFEDRTRRAMQALDAYTLEAQRELRRNPGLSRAREVSMTNRRLASEKLKSWWAERPL